MSTTDPDYYNVLSFNQWQLVMYQTLCLGQMSQQMDHTDEVYALRAFRDLIDSPDLLRYSCADIFLLGYRVMGEMEIVEEFTEYSVALGNIPQHFFHTAVQKCMLQMGGRPETIMEIVTMTHLNDYFRRLSPEAQALIIRPAHLLPHCFFFMAGYRFIEHLYKEVQDMSPPNALAMHADALDALLN
jgi:hypothetical protein